MDYFLYILISDCYIIFALQKSLNLSATTGLSLVRAGPQLNLTISNARNTRTVIALIKSSEIKIKPE